MQTNFTAAQLARPEIAEAKEILTTCVHYGFCTQGCPTYVLFRDENDAPRGRIDLIRAMLEKGGAPDPRTVHHLDRCLSCLSCMTTCAVNVDYLRLSDIGRAYIEENYRRPWPDRAFRAAIAALVPHPRRFRHALRAGRLARPLLRRLGGRLGGRLGALGALIPDRVAPDLLAPGIRPPEGDRRFRVALLAGCAQQVLDPAINRATLRLLARHGCEVVIADGAGCCGALTQHMGRMKPARAAMRPNIRAWIAEADGAGLDAVIVNASGCGTTVKEYGRLFADDPEFAAPAARVAALATDVSEFLDRLGLSPPVAPGGYRVAYHDPCSLQHAQRVRDQPRRLLAAAGYRVVDVPEGHFCCGSAGTFNMLQPAIACELGRRKAANIAATDPDIVATGNIGCITQLRLYSDLPVVHTVELLDWATGGPVPPALAGRALRPPAPVETATVTPAAGPGAPPRPSRDDVGIW